MRRIKNKKRVAHGKKLVQAVVPIDVARWLAGAARAEGLSLAAFVRRALIVLCRDGAAARMNIRSRRPSEAGR